MGPTWVLSAPDGPHVAPWTLLSGEPLERQKSDSINSVTLIKYGLQHFCAWNMKWSIKGKCNSLCIKSTYRNLLYWSKQRVQLRHKSNSFGQNININLFWLKLANIWLKPFISFRQKHTLKPNILIKLATNSLRCKSNKSQQNHEKKPNEFDTGLTYLLSV